MKNHTGSMSFKSNASTRAFQNEELQRMNMIMNEPIDNLIENIHTFIRPESSNPTHYHKKKNLAHISNRQLGLQQSKSIAVKQKERAMTAHVKPDYMQ
jgi:hypothetical protein